jgi:uncharacterized protein YegL
MNKELTEIVVVLDKSGSMGSIRQDTIGGFNTMLADQQKETSGKALLTLVTFNTYVQTVINGKDVNEVEPLTEKSYAPNGGTSLLDAIGKTIDSLEARYEDAQPEDVPAKVLFIIITDGEENASKEYNKSRIQKMIKHQTTRHGYDFIFLGANLDSVGEGAGLGVSSGQSRNFSASTRGISDTYGVLSKTTSMYRSGEYAVADALTMNSIGTSLEGLNKTVDIKVAPTVTADAIEKAVRDAVNTLKNSGGTI